MYKYAIAWHCNPTQPHPPSLLPSTFAATLQLLVQHLRDRERLPINVVRVDDSSMAVQPACKTQDEMRDLGIDGFLIDFVDAPDAVKLYLSAVVCGCRVHAALCFLSHASVLLAWCS